MEQMRAMKQEGMKTRQQRCIEGNLKSHALHSRIKIKNT